MRKSKLWKMLLHVEHVVLEDGDVEAGPGGRQAPRLARPAHGCWSRRCRQALLCLDAFHAVKRAGDALDKVRSRIAGELRAAGKKDQATVLGKGMWALRKGIAGLKQLYKAYLIKEQLREVFRAKGEHGKALR